MMRFLKLGVYLKRKCRCKTIVAQPNILHWLFEKTDYIYIYLRKVGKLILLFMQKFFFSPKRDFHWTIIMFVQKIFY